MFHKLVLMIVFAFAIGLVGCRSCWGPYDHCQPTFVPEAGDQCMGELYRNGSILGGMERRDGGCGSCSTCGGGKGGCSSCSGENNNAVYYEEGAYDAQNIIQPQNYSEAGPSEALPPRTGNASDNGASETIPTPQPNSPTPMNNNGSIHDFLPDSQTGTPDFSLGEGF